MHIVFLNQFFWPDTAATGQLLSDLADHLGQGRDDITVICGSHVDNANNTSYNGNYGSTDTSPAPEARIIRLKNTAFSRKFTGRMGSYLSFLAAALWKSLWIESPDVVVTLTTPPLLSLVGLALQRLRGARHIIWEMDVYPDVAIDLGVIKPQSLTAKFFTWLADLPRHHADSIIVLGECMRDRLLAHGIPAKKIIIAHNWADAAPREPAPAEGPLSVLYSGNFGLAHDVETIANAICQSKDNDAKMEFLFGGAGSRNAWLQTFCETHQIKNVRFFPYCDRPALSARIAASHIGLVTQKNECLGSAVPSKVYGIMAAARPVLFIGPKASTPARLIAEHNCGWQIDTGDTAGLTALLNRLNQNRDELTAAGDRAHQAFHHHYQRAIGVAHIASILGPQLPTREPLAHRTTAKV